MSQARRVGIVLALVVALVVATASPALVAAPASPLAISSPRHQVAVEISAPAAIAVDLTTGVTLYEREADAAMAPASTAKLVAALTVRRLLGRWEQITIEESDLVDEEFSRMEVEPGDVLTVEQLLYGALVPSGGDAGNALARVAGSRLDPNGADPIDRFVQEMNQVGVSLEMNRSSFGNPIGIDDEQSWTTARDLVRAADAVFSDPLLNRIVRTQWASVSVGGPNARDLTIENTNQFVLFDGAIGVKTGTTDAAGQNLVNAFIYGDHVIVTVVLGSDDRYADTSALLGAIEAQWRWLKLGGDWASLGATEELGQLGLWMPVARTIVIEPGQLERMSYELHLVEDHSGLFRGTVRFHLDGILIVELPVYTQGDPAGES